MRFADRMSLLGTETAFEVLVKARALEATGKDVVHWKLVNLTSIPHGT